MNPLVSYNEDKLTGLVNDDALAQGTAAGDILKKGLIAGMDVVGGKMESEDINPAKKYSQSIP